MSAAFAAEILKVCRADWVSRPEIARQLGLNETTIRIYCEELLRQGILVEQPRQTFKQVMAQCVGWRKAGKMKEGGKRRCRRFRVAKEWGGQGDQP